VAAALTSPDAPDSVATPAPEIAVVCPTYRRSEQLRHLVTALEAQTLDPNRFEVVVVDNASGDGTGAVLAELAAASPLRMRILATEINRGPAPARNLGWRATAAPVVAFADDDVLPAPDWLSAGLEALRRDPSIGVLQGRTALPPGTPPFAQLAPWSVWRVIDGAGPFFEACNIFYRRDALVATGGFDEAIGWWGEDTDLGWKVLEAGWQRGFAPAATVVHQVEGRSVGWHVRQGLNDRKIVGIAAAHPAFRTEAFWRPWAFRDRDAVLALALVAAVAARRRPVAALAVLPYLWVARPTIKGRPALGRTGWVRHGAELVAVDTARLGGCLVGAVRHRTLVL